MNAAWRAARRPLMVVGLVTLITAMWGGLVRMGWTFPLPRVSWSAHHGALMVSGFLGTLIALERAVGWNRSWAYLGPVFTALGALVGLVAGQATLSAVLFAAGSLVVVAVFVDVARVHRALATRVMGGAALAWVVGNSVWAASNQVALAVPWWIAFLVLTIAGERLELGQLRNIPAQAQRVFLVAVSGVIIGAVVSVIHWLWGIRVMGLGLLVLTAWLTHYDVARRTVRQRGLPRYAAVALLAGYVWLGVGGLIALLWGTVKGGFFYDAVLHAILVGFVMSMVFAHAPIVFPAVMQVSIPFSPAFYVPLGLLHLTVAARVVGDLLVIVWLRKAGGLGNALAIVLFLLTVVASVLRGRRSGKA